jgi:hypothetical protein
MRPLHKTLRLFVCSVLLSALALPAQNTPKSIALTDKSNVPAKDIIKFLRKECPPVGITTDATKADYLVEAVKKTVREGLRIVPEDSFDITLLDHDGRTVRSTSTTSLGNAMKDLCHAIRTAVTVEVVDTQNLTQSTDARGEGPGVVGVLVNNATGRRTHTDTSSIYVIVNGEHALLDCYERRTGCATIGPGKYYGELEGDGIWVSYQISITHKQMRDHYKIAGSW